MKIFNGSGFPTPTSDLAFFPQFLTADRGFWVVAPDAAASAGFPSLDPAGMAAVCANAKANYNNTLILDIETTYLAKNTVASNLFDAWVAILSDVIDMAHANGVKVGMYGLPIAINPEANYITNVANWNADNTALQKVVAKLDILCPSFYGLSMDLGSWCSIVSNALNLAAKLWPNKLIYPYLCGRAIANDPAGAFEDKTLFYRRLVFLKNWPVPAVIYWDAQFNPTQAYKTLGDLPFYNMMKLAVEWDPIYPPDGPNWLA